MRKGKKKRRKTRKLKKSELSISILEDINLMYNGYSTLSKRTRTLCALYNKERKKVFTLREKVLDSMIKDYDAQK